MTVNAKAWPRPTPLDRALRDLLTAARSAGCPVVEIRIQDNDPRNYSLEIRFGGIDHVELVADGRLQVEGGDLGRKLTAEPVESVRLTRSAPYALAAEVAKLPWVAS